eukprot:358448-Chlamydomonas_euryale.AAC.7
MPRRSSPSAAAPACAGLKHGIGRRAAVGSNLAGVQRPTAERSRARSAARSPRTPAASAAAPAAAIKPAWPDPTPVESCLSHALSCACSNTANTAHRAPPRRRPPAGPAPAAATLSDPTAKNRRSRQPPKSHRQ